MTLLKCSLPVLGYLLGSVPFGAIFFSFRHDADIRSLGSGNIGATNVMRNAGPALGLVTLFADMAKGGIPVAAANLLNAGELTVALTGLAAFMGHLYPLYTDFKGGGKGVATAAGVLLALTPVGFLWTFLVFLAGFFATGMVSAGSLCAAMVLPLTAFACSGSVPAGLAAVAMCVLIFVRHGANVARIKDGKEPRVFRSFL